MDSLTHVSFSIQADHDPNLHIKKRFHQLLKTAENYNIVNFDVITIHDCSQNIERLVSLKKEARKITKEHASIAKRITKAFQLCCIDFSGSSWNVQDEYKRTSGKIDQLIANNRHTLQVSCQNIVSDPKSTSDRDDMLLAFLWGTMSQSRQLHFRTELRTLYGKIEKNVRQDFYALESLRDVVKMAGSILPEHCLITRVESGDMQFIFHDLLLLHQFKRIRTEHPDRLPFKISLEKIHPDIIENLFQIIEEGREPTFKHFKEEGAVKFLEACAYLDVHDDIVNEGLFLLQKKSHNLHLTIYQNFVKVSCSGGTQCVVLKNLSVINTVRPIRFLNLTFSGIAPTIDVLNTLSTHFLHLRVLECSPYSTAGEADWKRLFDLPSLKKIVFSLSDEDEDYLAGLLAAIECHPKPPRIHVKNDMGVRHELLSQFLFRN